MNISSRDLSFCKGGREKLNYLEKGGGDDKITLTPFYSIKYILQNNDVRKTSL